jgi:hypothetical protein
MSAATTRAFRIARAALAALLATLYLAGADHSIAANPVNLALHRPARSSSDENGEHVADRANDGDPETCWRADDEPEGGPEWWQVDLGSPCDLSGCQIRWPFHGKHYRYKVEGSADGKHWQMLSDQTAAATISQVHKLKFPHARQVRYVKITVTGFDEGCWASISEVKVFGIPMAAGVP